MFVLDKQLMQHLVRAFGIQDTIVQMQELLRYEEEEFLRLILKVEFEIHKSIVVKLKHEPDVTPELLEAQCAFSEHLARNGIATARFFRTENGFVRECNVHGQRILMTVEEFVQGEVSTVDADIAYETGRTMAQAHNIAQRDDLHVKGAVLFDPFGRNDLFSHEIFAELREEIPREASAIYERVEALYQQHMRALECLKRAEAYAVQGDISNCNLFISEHGRIGMFDFNRCGDNRLFCDMVMQARFEARFMDYDHTLSEGESERIFSAFMAGYMQERALREEEVAMLPHLLAIIDAFWQDHVYYGENSLVSCKKRGDVNGCIQIMEKMEKILLHGKT